jgi:hypothetical protein
MMTSDRRWLRIGENGVIGSIPRWQAAILSLTGFAIAAP